MTCLNSAKLGKRNEAGKGVQAKGCFFQGKSTLGRLWVRKPTLASGCASAAAVEEYDPTRYTWRMKNMFYVHLSWGEIGVKTSFVSVNGVNKNQPWVLLVGL
uniref:Uncharacterized protein n=1 Tax=Spongospora subterranea TaxID=70186 RepID=A0A0H5RE90_9EUKA|eukprot:CRZ12565.1 hypothetical protein [Spongospora subterranea]